MKNREKQIPKFKNEDEERKFWSDADTSEYYDYSKFKKVKFPNLKLSTESISIRLPKSLLDDIKIFANSRDIPYQSLMKIMLFERLEEMKVKK